MHYDIITILGPTAVGKTKLAVNLAHHFNGEIISADSRQVYKRMDIGTGKDLSDYTINGQEIQYHLIDIVEPFEEFSLYNFVESFKSVYSKIKNKNKTSFLVGGTGLYLHAILKGYELAPVNFDSKRYEELYAEPQDKLVSYLEKINPHLHNTTDILYKERTIKAILVSEQSGKGNQININSLNIGIYEERDILKKRITGRLKNRLKDGMIEEVENLMKEGITKEKLEFFGLEYKYIGKYVSGELNYNDAFQKLNSSIHKFAKKQMTWFRKMEREGIKIYWIKPGEINQAKRIIEENFFSITDE